MPQVKQREMQQQVLSIYNQHLSKRLEQEVLVTKLSTRHYHYYSKLIVEILEQRKKMPISRIAIGNPSEFGQADALKAALAEFISMLIFVFAGEGSGMAYSKALFICAQLFSVFCFH